MTLLLPIEFVMHVNLWFRLLFFYIAALIFFYCPPFPRQYLYHYLDHSLLCSTSLLAQCRIVTFFKLSCSTHFISEWWIRTSHVVNLAAYISSTASRSLAPQQHILISPVSDCHICQNYLQHTFYIRVVDSVVARRNFLGLYFLDSISITRSSAVHSD